MFQRPRGTRDFGPDEMARRRWAEDRMRAEALRCGFREIQMPIFENLELFTTKSGSEIVEELYAFKDKGGRDIALRPEMTAQVMRFYVSDLAVLPKPLKVFYFGPCFRYENPQAGRFREFSQIGAEIIGANTPETDAEVIALAVSMVESVGLKDFVVRIGYIGILRRMLEESGLSNEKLLEGLHYLDKNEEKKFAQFARDNAIPSEKMASVIAIRKLRGDTTVLEQLDSKEAGEYLREVMRCLSSFKVKNCEVDLGIVRGLDYYTGMVFEIDALSLGAEKQVCGGGSYELVPLFGGEQVFTTGFALGFDRVLIALENEGLEPTKQTLDVYIVPIGDNARRKALEIVASLRESNLSVDFDTMRRSLSKNLKYAASVNTKKVIILGERELSKGIVTVRDMISGEQKEIEIKSLESNIDEILNN